MTDDDSPGPRQHASLDVAPELFGGDGPDRTPAVDPVEDPDGTGAS